ncbi:hypothetical protein [Methanothermobacter marburgensis]|uniref:hypothetical protein n=1 Tax=Methanothermobacter marburgensis TaxID=145263 RepID=UPI0035B994C7
MVELKSRILIAGILLLIVTPLVIMNLSDHSTIGSDSRGYVTKDVYAHYGKQNIKIAVVTGIHPREEVSVAPVQWASRAFALLPVEVALYSINVEDSPMDYSKGRANGEGLAATYILPDVMKSDYDLVIIAHAHAPGYGEGFYVATPQMDEPSVQIAESLRKEGFNYYPVSGKTRYRSSSARLFSRPLAAAGYPTLVYEVPEWSSAYEVFFMTLKLLRASSSVLS